MTIQPLRSVHSQGLESLPACAPLSDLGDSPALLASASVRAYKGAWGVFTAWWMETYPSPIMPASPDVVARYLEALAPTRKAATLTKHLAAIAHYHQAAGFESPTTTPLVRRTLRKLRREHGTAQTAKAPLLIEHIRQICDALPDTRKGKRDRCVLLLGFAGGFRRSELTQLVAGDLTFTPQGVQVRLRRSKTDQEGQGRDVAVPYGRTVATCPVRACQEWIAVLKAAAKGEFPVTSAPAAALDPPFETTPLLRTVNRHDGVGKTALSAEAVGDIVKLLTGGIGLEGALYAGHSLRAGLATSAAMEGADDRAIMRQTGHKSRQMVDRYIRAANLWKDNAAARAGL